MIGIFDSGSGGLTILDRLRERFPDQAFLYLGDHGNAPYGMRDARDLFDLCCRNISILMDRGCRLVVLACNTASIAVLRRIQREWLPSHYPGCRVLGVFVPMVEYLTGWDWREERPVETGLAGRVTFFATPSTVRSGRFSREVVIRNSRLDVRETACPALVRAIEDHACGDVLDVLVENYVRRSGIHDQEENHYAVLGCTHYPLVEARFRSKLPSNCQLLSQADVVAESLQSYLGRHPEMIVSDGAQYGTGYLTSGNPARVSRTVSRFLQETVSFEAV